MGNWEWAMKPSEMASYQILCDKPEQKCPNRSTNNEGMAKTLSCL